MLMYFVVLSSFLGAPLARTNALRPMRAIVLSLSFGVPAKTQTPNTSRQTSDLDRAIAQYKNGDFNAAIKALQTAAKQKRYELSARHYLGLAFERLGKTSNASKAHERAANLGDYLLETRFLKGASGNSKSSDIDFHETLLQAAESAEKYIELNAKLSGSKRAEWNDRVESLRYFAEIYDPLNANSDQPQLFSPKEVDTKARILSKQEPGYTVEARQHQVTGTIILRVVLAADGKVRGIVALKTLPDGLTQMAIDAARRIRFVPAIKNGKPVSMFMQLEYSFNLY
jgi:TonB family protein